APAGDIPRLANRSALQGATWRDAPAGDIPRLANRSALQGATWSEGSAFVFGSRHGAGALRQAAGAAQALQVGVVDVAGDITAVEAGRLEGLHGGIQVAQGLFQIVQILVDQAVGADLACNLRLVTPGGDQFRLGRHVDAVDVRIADGRRRRCEEDLVGARRPRHVDDFTAGGAAHDGIIDQQDIL